MQINCVCMLDHGLEITRIEEQNPKQNSIKQRWVLNLFTIHKQHLNHSMCIYLCHIRGFRMYTVYSNKKDWEQREREVNMDMLPAAAVVPLGGRA